MISLFPSHRQKRIRFNPEEARRVVPQRLVERGLVPTIEEGKRAVELVISAAEKEEVGTQKD